MQIKTIEDLRTLLPISGSNLVSYEVRGEYVKAALSKTAEKNFGIPQFDTTLTYVNEPLIKNAEYGDIVAAIQIDKNSPIIDTRKDNRFQT